MKTVRLTEIFRQAQESLIVVNAHRINHGELPLTKSAQGQRRNFYFLQRDEPEKALDAVKVLVGSRLPSAFHLNPLDDIQVMTPMHKGMVGVANLNAELQRLLNPEGQEITRA